MADAKTKLRCPACRGKNLSEEAEYASFQNHARFRDWSVGLLGGKDLCMAAERARICLDCGYMLFFAGEEKLRELAEGRS